MALNRLVIFIPDAVVAEYDSLADTVAGSRSALMRWALEHALPSVRDHVLSVAAAGVVYFHTNSAEETTEYWPPRAGKSL